MLPLLVALIIDRQPFDPRLLFNATLPATTAPNWARKRKNEPPSWTDRAIGARHCGHVLGAARVEGRSLKPLGQAPGR